MNVIARLLISPIAALVASCSLYNGRVSPVETSPGTQRQDFTVQVDDYGRFLDKQHADKVLQTIDSESKLENTIVVLFVHGWHHNADPTDENVRSFNESLAVVRQRLNDAGAEGGGLYSKSREELTGSADVKVIGVYVGWRGKSLPMPLDYATFWDRKAAASRVGQGDLREFLLRLDKIYRQRNSPSGGRKTLMGMVSIGHSFGGQVLFSAVGPSIERELIGHTSLDGKSQLQEPLSGFGDLVVLINPALEAMQYDRISRLSKEIVYPPRQGPVMLVISAENDIARQKAFPLGRDVAALGRAGFQDDTERAEWTTALGEYEPQRTHAIDLSDNSNDGFDPELYSREPCSIARYDLTNVPSIGGVTLRPTSGREALNNPFIVAYASRKVVMGHSGIFESTLNRFLNDYVAIAEGKHFVQSSGRCNSSPKRGANR